MVFIYGVLVVGGVPCKKIMGKRLKKDAPLTLLPVGILSLLYYVQSSDDFDCLMIISYLKNIHKFMSIFISMDLV